MKKKIKKNKESDQVDPFIETSKELKKIFDLLNINPLTMKSSLHSSELIKIIRDESNKKRDSYFSFGFYFNLCGTQTEYKIGDIELDELHISVFLPPEIESKDIIGLK